jgi:hypothetical protein
MQQFFQGKFDYYTLFFVMETNIYHVSKTGSQITNKMANNHLLWCFLFLYEKNEQNEKKVKNENNETY